MLTTLDDYLVHQIVDTVDHVGTSDPNFYDRYWFELGDANGELLFNVGMALYPNLQIIDGYATATVDDKRQHNMRVSRDMTVDGGIPDRADTRVGPIRVEVIKGLKQLRIVVEPNKYDMACDILWDAPQEPFERPRDFARYRGRVTMNTCHFNQGARLTGTARVGNRTWNITPDRWFGIRDHSWGIRGVGDPEKQPEPRPTSNVMVRGDAWVWQWFAAQWPDHYTYYHRLDVADGRTTRGTWGEFIYPGVRPHTPVVEAHVNKIEYVPMFGDIYRMKTAEFEMTDDKGQKHVVTATHLTLNYIRAGGYAGYKGYYHGLYMGPYFEDGEVWDFANEADMRDADAFKIVDHWVRYESEGQIGYGIFEFSDGPARVWFQKYAPERIVK